MSGNRVEPQFGAKDKPTNRQAVEERRDWWIKELQSNKPHSKAALLAAKFIHSYDRELSITLLVYQLLRICIS